MGGGGNEEREWEITPQPEGALSVVTCFLRVPWAGEAVMQARECWWQKHLRSPVSRRGVHPTSPVHHCPWLYDCVFAASACQPLHNITIPTVGKHNMEHPHHLNSPLLPSPPARKWLYTVTVHQPMPPSICPSVGFPSLPTAAARKLAWAILWLGSLQGDFVKKVAQQKFTFSEQSASHGRISLVFLKVLSGWEKRITPFWQQWPWSVSSFHFTSTLGGPDSTAFCRGDGSMVQHGDTCLGMMVTANV